MNEAGYQALEVGVGCSLGTNETQWLDILAHGTQPNPISPDTVWPIYPTVAVSQRMYKQIRDKMCWSRIKIRNSQNTSQEVTAAVIDWCPSKGCNWPNEELAFNVDIYGEKTWVALGGPPMGGGKINVEVIWPEGVDPYTQRPESTGLADALSGLSGGAIAGIVIGVIVLLAILGGAIWFALRKVKERKLLGRYK